MVHLVSSFLSRLWPARLRCPHCGAEQRVTRDAVAGEFRVLCWRCRRMFSP
jgi:predicted Zn finger-like uncharacterized protein